MSPVPEAGALHAEADNDGYVLDVAPEPVAARVPAPSPAGAA